MPLSRKAKEAIKTALAVTIAYGIVLSMGWKNPYWAGFAVAFCSLATAGESLHKGLLRIGGTFVAFFVALTLVTLFPQDRWLFFGALSIYLAFCNYMMGGTSRWYFWYVAAFTVPLLAFGGGPGAVNKFETVVLRAQLTTLGVVVYTLVSSLLWPTSTKDLFEGTVKQLVSAQRQLFCSYITGESERIPGSEVQGLRIQVVQESNALKGLLNGAEIDSLEIWEIRHVWRQCIAKVAELNIRMDRWEHAFKALGEIDLDRMVPEFSAYTSEIDTRFGQIEQMLAGSAPTAQPLEIKLWFDPVAGRHLSHFHRAAIIIFMNQFKEIDQLTQMLFDHVSSIRGFIAEQKPFPKGERPKPSVAFDLDHAGSILRMLSTLWMALLILYYLPDVPADTAFLNITISIALILLTMPQVRISTLVRPVYLSILFASIVHIFIMPHLDGFTELALVIFAVTFFMGYLFAKPEQMISKSVGIAMFFLLTSIDTPQVYSFLKIANVALVIALVLGLLTVTTYFPLSFQPERRFLYLLVRFFRSSKYLVAAVSPPEKSWGIESWRRAFHLHEVMTIPVKLVPWSRALTCDALGKTSSAQLQDMLISLEFLGWHIQELAEARKEIRSINVSPQDLDDDMQAWRSSLETLFARLSVKPDAEDHAALRKALDRLLERINVRIEETFNDSDSQSLTPENEKNTYQLLGVYRGLSEALVTYARRADSIDWPRLAEDRF
jgi:uncharacterized membrane protein YgaE (UPF0421/DUF939 family)